jgi:hypothetical protein
MVKSPGPFSVPSASRSRARWMSPLSNTSSSGSTPASFMAFAILRTLAGVLMTTSGPEFMVFRSREQMSGFSSITCLMRSSGGRSVVPSA